MKLKFWSLLIIVILGYNLSIFGKIIKYDLTSPKKFYYNLKDVCRYYQIKQAPLVSMKNASTIDCMGKESKVHNFCKDSLKKENLPEKHGLIRSFVDPKHQKVVCQTAKSVALRYLCQNNKQPYCVNALKNCTSLKQMLSQEIPLVHSSITEDFLKSEKILNCYFFKQ